jgi:hypothetical protein
MLMGCGTGVAVGNGVKVVVGSGVDVEVKAKVEVTESTIGVERGVVEVQE